MDDESDQDSIIEEDYYAFLNVSRNATPDEIHQAFRRQSRLYHPDKHIDPALKKKAEVLFSRTNKAYEVLKDPHQRAIYDSLGVKGLETKGWEIVQRTQTPQEIREEYERIAREREQKRLEQRTNLTGNITVHVNATDLFNKYDDDYQSPLFGGIETTGMTFEQSIEAPLTLRDKLILYGLLDIQNGVGVGTINVAARRALSAKNYLELDVGGGNGPNVALKGYHALTDRVFTTGALSLQFSPEKAQLGMASTLGMQLDKHTVGYLTHKTGFNGSMSMRVVTNSERSFTSFSIQFGFINSYASLSYTYKMPEKKMKLRGAVRVGTSGYFVEYGAEKRVSKHSFLSAAVRVGVPSGVSLRLKLMRASQTYLLPISLCEDVLPAPVFYATVAPLITWTFVKKLIIDPVVKEQKEREREKQKELNKARMLEKQREARAAVDLMMATFSRIRAEEEAKGGLVITKALYGRFVYPDRRNRDEEIDSESKDDVIDVTVPLQCLVVNSRLVLHEAAKSELPGFYDPCFGEDKQMLLQYLFHRQTHECLVKDLEPLRIPVQSHRVNTT
ncbi:dnaJ homolog subfamily C member 11 isoform X1 [Fopius arisanus]|uniref:DnaJ homolog subfamily C member 11 isoform X1 n=2 Tax=Fopius arisanus TaxID=64838 RepID=A0A0C9QG58_9HYME|nr:PREDICTED: dnaJ homolog subfamily C member 11 isoform X1 [Fopius arisanus]